MASRVEFPDPKRAGLWPEAGDPATKLKILENPTLRAYIDEVERRAAECRARPVASLPFSRFRMFDESGDRGRFEEPYFERRRALVACGLSSWLFGRTEDIAALEDLIWAICDEYTWALPAHLERTSLDPRCLPRVAGPGPGLGSCPMPGNGHGRSAGMTVHPELLDLFSCETAFALAELCSLLEDRMTLIVAERARREARRHVLAPFLARKEPWRWELMRNNWCAVCAGSVGAAALYLVRDSDELAAILDRVLPTLDRFLESFADDGTCLEGLGYWTYGVGFFVSFADLLERLTVSRPDLLTNEKFRRVASFQKSCYLNESMAVSFADGSPQERYRTGLTDYLARRFPEAASPARTLAAGFGHDRCGRWCLSFRDLMWTRGTGGLAAAGTADGVPGLSGGPPGLSDGPSGLSEKLSGREVDAGDIRVVPKNDRNAFMSLPSPDPVWLPDAQWLLCSARREGGLAFAAKGGHNDEPHNHNDIGSFELVLGERQLLADLGRGEYTRDYFSENRYSIFCNSSFGHSLPIVDGRGQLPGPERRARNVEFRREGGMSILSMDIAAAYDCEFLIRLTRRFAFDGDGRNGLRLTDEFEFSRPGVEVTERFVTACPVWVPPESARKSASEFVPQSASAPPIAAKPLSVPEAVCFIVDAGESADAGGSALALRVSCDVPGGTATLSTHEHREHDGGGGIVNSLDWTTRSAGAVFACGFEFRLVPPGFRQTAMGQSPREE